MVPEQIGQADNGFVAGDSVCIPVGGDDQRGFVDLVLIATFSISDAKFHDDYITAYKGICQGNEYKTAKLFVQFTSDRRNPKTAKLLGMPAFTGTPWFASYLSSVVTYLFLMTYEKLFHAWQAELKAIHESRLQP